MFGHYVTAFLLGAVEDMEPVVIEKFFELLNRLPIVNFFSPVLHDSIVIFTQLFLLIAFYGRPNLIEKFVYDEFVANWCDEY